MGRPQSPGVPLHDRGHAARGDPPLATRCPTLDEDDFASTGSRRKKDAVPAPLSVLQVSRKYVAADAAGVISFPSEEVVSNIVLVPTRSGYDDASAAGAESQLTARPRGSSRPPVGWRADAAGGIELASLGRGETRPLPSKRDNRGGAVTPLFLRDASVSQVLLLLLLLSLSFWSCVVLDVIFHGWRSASPFGVSNACE